MTILHPIFENSSPHLKHTHTMHTHASDTQTTQNANIVKSEVSFTVASCWSICFVSNDHMFHMFAMLGLLVIVDLLDIPLRTGLGVVQPRANLP